MNTQPDNLPFIKDPLFDYILTDDDRQKFALLQVTDEWWCGLDTGWRATDRDIESGFNHCCSYRRRKSSGWVSVKERLPEDGQPIYAVKDGKLFWYGTGISGQGTLQRLGFTYWQPWTLPALPQPPKPAAEVAFEVFSKTPNFYKCGALDLWLACAAWAKDHKEAL